MRSMVEGASMIRHPEVHADKVGVPRRATARAPRQQPKSSRFCRPYALAKRCIMLAGKLGTEPETLP